MSRTLRLHVIEILGVTVTVTFVQVERHLFVRMCSCRLFYLLL